MSEWWTYRLSDFLMFSPRTYYRIIELYNIEAWPGHWVGLGLGAAALSASRSRRAGACAAIWAALAACWIWVAWAFLLRWYGGIHWAASWFAATFAIEGGLLILISGAAARWRARASGTDLVRTPNWRQTIGRTLVIFALVVHPCVAVLLGRPWQQAEVFGLAPDPTALGTLGLLLIVRPVAGIHRTERLSRLVWLLWPIPVLWCLVSGATLWTMAAPEALLMPGAAMLAVLAAWRGRALKPGRRVE